MDLKTYCASRRGATSEIARAVRLPSQLVWQWKSGSRPVPVDRCHAIEAATGGVVSCEELRPDVVWRRHPAFAWQWHPEGRPLVDLTQLAVGAQWQPAANATCEARHAA